MSKDLEVKLSEEKDWSGYITSQHIDCENEDISYYVNNLNECPEDAIIGRDLFDCYDYIKVLNKGIELANKGYTKVVIKNKENK